MTAPLMLQHCAECGAVQYPRREACMRCLSPDLQWRETPGGGTLLSHTALHVSVDAKWQDRLPVRLALVRLDAGPVVYALAADDLTRRGMRVTVTRGDDDLLQAGREE